MFLILEYKKGIIKKGIRNLEIGLGACPLLSGPVPDALSHWCAKFLIHACGADNRRYYFEKYSAKFFLNRKALEVGNPSSMTRLIKIIGRKTASCKSKSKLWIRKPSASAKNLCIHLPFFIRTTNQGIIIENYAACKILLMNLFLLRRHQFSL